MVDYKGVELARTGSFDASTGPVTLTTKDFDNMAEAYQSLQGKVDIPVKLGHDLEQDALSESGMPAAGWVENVKRQGNKLVADIMRVPEAVSKLIDQGSLRKRSIEAVRNVTLAGKKWPMALTGLALLGSELPAVDSLEDIAKLYASGRVLAAADVPDRSSVVVIQMATDNLAPAAPPTDLEQAQTLIDELGDVINRIATTTAGRKGAPKLRQLLAVAVDVLKTTGPVVRAEHKNSEDNTDMDIAVLRTRLALPETATEDEVLAALDEKLKPKVEEPGKTEGSPPANAELAAMRQELTAASQELIKLKNSQARELVTVKVDDAIKARKFMPAARDGLIKLAIGDLAAFDEMVSATPENAILAPEKGTASSDGIPDEVQPTKIEASIGAQIGLSDDAILRFKAREAGVKLPDKKEA